MVPHPVLYSMVSFGAVIVEPGLSRTFRGETAPISEKWIPEALAISGVTREQHLGFPLAMVTISKFHNWLEGQKAELGVDRFTMISDNPSYDHAFMNWYGWRYLDLALLGHSGRRINDLFAGSKNNAGATQGWKKLRKTKHTHDPLDDAMGMAEALLGMKKRGMKFAMIPESTNV
jgi:predicted nucleic acid-binding protein